MRTLALGLAVACALVATTGTPSAADAGRILGQADLVALDGTPISIGEMDASVVVVNFWATWCRPCQRELETMNAWSHELAGRGVSFLAISVDTDRGKVDRFLAKHGIDLIVVHDGPDGLAQQLDLPYLPCTYVLDGSGQVVWLASTAEAATLDRLREKLLALALASATEVSR